MKEKVLAEKVRLKIKRHVVVAYIQNKKIKKKMKLADLGRLVGISTGYWSQLLTGRRYPNEQLRARLMKIMGIKETKKLFELVKSEQKD